MHRFRAHAARWAGLLTVALTLSAAAPLLACQSVSGQNQARACCRSMGSRCADRRSGESCCRARFAPNVVAMFGVQHASGTNASAAVAPLPLAAAADLPAPAVCAVAAATSPPLRLSPRLAQTLLRI